MAMQPLSSCLSLLLAAIICNVAPTTAGAQGDDIQATSLMLDGRLAPEPAPRVLLDAPVTLRTTGTVYDVVRQLVGDRGFLVATRGNDFGAPADLAADNVPLWQALDGLRPVFGYDWGTLAGVVLVWPCGPSPTPREALSSPKLADVTQGTPLSFDRPTPLEEAVASAQREGALGRSRIVAAPELAAWKLAGNIPHTSPEAMAGWVAAVVGADRQGTDRVIVLNPGPTQRLAEALTFLDSRPEPFAGDDLRLRLEAGIDLLLVDQQWALIGCFGTAEVSFREMPTPLAALFAAVCRGYVLGTDYSIDWSRPDKMKATVRVATRQYQDPVSGERYEARHKLKHEIYVPLAKGGNLAF